MNPDAAYQADFLAHRRVSPNGLSLKDLDLATRLFQHRCSYMIYSPVFEGLPAVLKTRIYAQLRAALRVEDGTKEFGYLPAAEKTAIQEILIATLKDLPPGW